jgi:hypothetical protein
MIKAEDQTELKPEDLRRGNLVYGVSDRVEVVNEILSVYVETSFRGGLLNYSKYEDIEPIPLNEEWLIKLGFENNGQQLFDLNDFTIKFKKAQNLCVVYYRNVWIVDLKYVHRLQNLYFALLGTELTRKP